MSLKNLISRAARKWIRCEADERAVANGCRFDEAAAARVVEFFPRFLRHSKGNWAGKPFELVPWQRDEIIYPLFGWMRADGTRRFRKAYVEIPKKNGKSTLAAGIGIFMLAGDGEMGAEVYSAATGKSQAAIVHNEAIAMVEASPALSAHLVVNRSTKNIAWPGRNSYYRCLTGEGDTNEGLNAHCIIGDELHVWQGRALWDALKYAFRARRQGLLFVITTAGDDLLSVCREQHDYAEDVIAGQIQDERYFGFIRAAGPSDNFSDPRIQRKANPSMGITIDEREFKADLEEAKKMPTTWAAFLRYSFNVWQTATTPWLDMHKWDACGAEGGFTRESLAGRECYGALDLAMVSDMTAFALLFPEGETAKLLAWFWLPEATAEGNEHYLAWARSGHLILTPGDSTDFSFVRKQIAQLAKEFNVRSFAYDSYHAPELVTQLQEEDGMVPHEFPQTIASFAAPTARFEKMVVDRQLLHPRHPILTWHAGNVNVRRDANGNMRPVKPPQGNPRKIDGIVAGIMALGEFMRFPADAGRSVYETRGVITV